MMKRNKDMVIFNMNKMVQNHEFKLGKSVLKLNINKELTKPKSKTIKEYYLF